MLSLNMRLCYSANSIRILIIDKPGGVIACPVFSLGLIMADSLDVGLARVEEILKAVQGGMDRAEKSRKEMYQSVNGIELKLISVEHRITSLEKSFNDVSPTIAEFVVIKNRVQGAGNLGKYLWIFGGVLLSATAWVVGIFQSFNNWGK